MGTGKSSMKIAILQSGQTIFTDGKPFKIGEITEKNMVVECQIKDGDNCWKLEIPQKNESKHLIEVLKCFVEIFEETSKDNIESMLNKIQEDARKNKDDFAHKVEETVKGTLDKIKDSDIVSRFKRAAKAFADDSQTKQPEDKE